MYLSYEDPAWVIKVRLERIREAAGASDEKLHQALASHTLSFFCEVE